MIDTTEFQNVFTNLNAENIYPNKLGILLSNVLYMPTFEVRIHLKSLKTNWCSIFKKLKLNVKKQCCLNQTDSKNLLK